LHGSRISVRGRVQFLLPRQRDSVAEVALRERIDLTRRPVGVQRAASAAERAATAATAADAAAAAAQAELRHQLDVAEAQVKKLQATQSTRDEEVDTLRQRQQSKCKAAADLQQSLQHRYEQLSSKLRQVALFPPRPRVEAMEGWVSGGILGSVGGK
jgi:chromosome segregation ATPase